MAKKKAASKTAKKKVAKKKAPVPKSFTGVVRERTAAVQRIAKAVRAIVYEELPDVEESFVGGPRPIAMYRTAADVCWIQPQLKWCNIYFARGPELTDDEQLLEGTSDRFRHAKIRSLEDLDVFPIQAWLQESIELNTAATADGDTRDQVLEKMRAICLALPKTKETLTWGMPHFRVNEKIFCGCGEDQGGPRVGLKMEAEQSEMMMQVPGIVKAPYSRKGDGWVSIDPNVFDDWEEIESLLVGSYRLIAPKRVSALLDQ